MRILITGGTGLLGKSLIETAKKEYEIVATHLGNSSPIETSYVKYVVLDIRDQKNYADLYKTFRPDVTIHTAGVGSPDYAARHREETKEINVGGTKNIVRNCERFKSSLVYVSSNAVYDGDNAPYGENDETRPISYYGQIKLEGEKISREGSMPCSVVRPILLYGWNHPGARQNIVTYALSRLMRDEEVFVYNDVFVNPIFAQSCAEVIWRIVEGQRYETFNIAGRDTESIYRLVKSAARIFDLNPNLVVPVQQGFFNELVRRPKDTSYCTDKMRSELGVEPISVDDGLCLMKRSVKR